MSYYSIPKSSKKAYSSLCPYCGNTIIGTDNRSTTLRMKLHLKKCNGDNNIDISEYQSKGTDAVKKHFQQISGQKIGPKFSHNKLFMDM